MSRIMYDSVTASHIPQDAPMVAGYVNGTYRWSAADWARFPNAVKVRIATQANVNDGHVLDVEPGDATPAQAPGWVQRRRAAGIDPTVYCNQINGWTAVRQAFRDAGVAEPHYWVARYDGVAVIPAGAVAKQYKNPPGSGGHYDLSVVADHWPGIDQEDDMAGELADAQMTRVQEITESQIGRKNVEAAFVLTDTYNFAQAARDVAARVETKLDALANTLSNDEATLLAAIRSQPTGGQVDVASLAAALAPLLPADATPDQIADAVRTAFATHLGGTA